MNTNDLLMNLSLFGQNNKFKLIKLCLETEFEPAPFLFFLHNEKEHFEKLIKIFNN